MHSRKDVADAGSSVWYGATGARLGMTRVAVRPVAIVEDDESVRHGLMRLLRSADRKVVGYASAEEFLVRDPKDPPCCLIIDIHLGGISGTELAERLAQDNMTIPVVLISAGSEVAHTERLPQAGALTCLPKPLDEITLIQAIDAVISDGQQNDSVETGEAQGQGR